MRTAYALTLAAALAGSAVLSMPAGADEVCDKNCVGPACSTTCTREPNATVGRDRRDRDEVIIEERNRRAKQFGEATGREEFIKYVSGDWSRNWVQAAAARVAEEQPNWSPPMPAPVRISNEDGANAGISSQRGAASVKPPRPVHSLGEHSAAAVHP
jgi:hypothetical protein